MATEVVGVTFLLPSAVVASRIHMTLARRGVSCSPMAGLSANATRPALDSCACPSHCSSGRDVSDRDERLHAAAGRAEVWGAAQVVDTSDRSRTIDQLDAHTSNV